MRLSHSEVRALSSRAGVPFTTIWKIRDGTTTNPGIETVRLFYHLIGTLPDAGIHAEAVAGTTGA